MNILARKLFQYSGKVIKDNPDIGNPLNAETVDFFIVIGKGTIKIIKEVIMP